MKRLICVALLVFGLTGSVSNQIPVRIQRPNVTDQAAPDCSLPMDWTDEDLGSGQIPGSACSQSATEFELTGSGGIFGSSDQGHIARKVVTGNWEIVARVVDIISDGEEVEGGGEFCGVIIRNAAGADAVFGQAVIDGNDGAVTNFRTTIGGASSFYVGGIATWISVHSIDGVYSAAHSNNGVNWTPFGVPQDLGTSGSYRIGLSASNIDAGVTTRCIFDNVAIQAPTWPEEDPPSEDFGGYRAQYPPHGGYNTVGGRGGDIYFVNTLTWDTGSPTSCSGTCGGLATTAVCDTVTCFHGSLGDCLSASGPRYCLPTVSGYIDMPFVGDNTYITTNGNLTVAMQTAPSPGVTVRYSGLQFGGSDIVLQHLRIRPGSGPSGPCGGGLWLSGPDFASKIVADHVSVSWSMDENIGIGNAAVGNVLVWRSNASEPLSFHFPAEAPNCPQIEAFGGGPGHCASFDNTRSGQPAFVGESVVSSCPERMLWTYSRTVGHTLVNNLIHGFLPLNTVQAANFITDSSAFAFTAVGNRFIANTATCSAPAFQFNFINFVNGNQAYLSGNSLTAVMGCSNTPGNYYIWDNSIGACENMCLTYDPTSGVSSPPSGAPLPSGSGWAAKTSDAALETFVLANVGARPLDRDSAETRIISEIVNRTVRSGVFDQDSVGGWPTLTNNSSAPLAIPANPHGLGNCGGVRTNLECKLNQMAEDLEQAP